MFRSLLSLAFIIAPLFAKAPSTNHVNVSVTDIENYLTNLTTLSATFVQTNMGNQVVTGKFQVARPGKMRLDYDKPEHLVVVADGTWLKYHDTELDEITHVPLSKTPAEILLREKVKFDERTKVQKVENFHNEIHVTLVKASEPDAGSITLMFDKKPLCLKRWRVTDAQKNVTWVNLTDIKTGERIDMKKFKILPRHIRRDLEAKYPINYRETK